MQGSLSRLKCIHHSCVSVCGRERKIERSWAGLDLSLVVYEWVKMMITISHFLIQFLPSSRPFIRSCCLLKHLSSRGATKKYNPSAKFSAVSYDCFSFKQIFDPGVTKIFSDNRREQNEDLMWMNRGSPENLSPSSSSSSSSPCSLILHPITNE